MKFAAWIGLLACLPARSLARISDILDFDDHCPIAEIAMFFDETRRLAADCHLKFDSMFNEMNLIEHVDMLNLVRNARWAWGTTEDLIYRASKQSMFKRRDMLQLESANQRLGLAQDILSYVHASREPSKIKRGDAPKIRTSCHEDSYTKTTLIGLVPKRSREALVLTVLGASSCCAL